MGDGDVVAKVEGRYRDALRALDEAFEAVVARSYELTAEELMRRHVEGLAAMLDGFERSR